MNWKKRLLKKSHLYIIIDKKVSKGRSIFKKARIIKDLGADIIQLRDKDSKKECVLKEAFALRKLLFNSKVIFIINDYIDIARIVNSDGVHLGQTDTSLEIARQLLDNDKIIGVSCHNLTQAIEAQNRGADYISIGPIFPTATKPEYKSKTIGLDLIKRAKNSIHIPFFVIGGINEGNISKVLLAGAKRVAVCRAVCLAKDIKSSIKNLKNQLKNDTIRIRKK